MAQTTSVFLGILYLLQTNMALPTAAGASLPTKRYECSPQSSLLIIPYLWVPTTLRVTGCSVKAVYVANSREGLQHNLQDGQTAWCGFHHLVGNGACTLQLSPFKRHYIAVDTLNTGCDFQEVHEADYFMLGCLVAGVLLFSMAKTLSGSISFRVTAGGLMFSLACVVFLSFWLARFIPNRRSLLAAGVALGSTSLTLLRWATGHWAPSVTTLLQNRWFLAYLCVSGLTGAAFTYIYGGVEDPKATRVFRVFLHLLGVILVYFGTWTHLAVSALVISALVTSQFTWPLLGRILRANHREPAPQERSPLSRLLATPNSTKKHRPTTPVHLKSQPPTPQEVADRLAKPRVTLTFEEKMAQINSEAVHRGRKQHTQAVSDAVADHPAESIPKDEHLSPLVRSGRILNPDTRRSIKIGGDVYQRLVEHGYVPDMQAGVLKKP